MVEMMGLDRYPRFLLEIFLLSEKEAFDFLMH